MYIYIFCVYLPFLLSLASNILYLLFYSFFFIQFPCSCIMYMLRKTVFDLLGKMKEDAQAGHQKQTNMEDIGNLQGDTKFPSLH